MLLAQLVEVSKSQSPYIQWTAISSFFKDRTPVQCKAIYRKLNLETYIKRHPQYANIDICLPMRQNKKQDKITFTDNELGQMEFKTMSKFERFQFMAEWIHCRKDVEKIHRAFPQMKVKQIRRLLSPIEELYNLRYYHGMQQLMDEKVLSTMTNHLLLLRYNGISMITYLVHYLGIQYQEKLPNITPSDLSLVKMVVNDKLHRPAFLEFASSLNLNFNLRYLNERVGNELEKRGTWDHLLRLSQSEDEIRRSEGSDKVIYNVITM